MTAKSKDDTHELSTWLVQELRTDHAGETGAIAIYNGILAVSSNKQVRDFAVEHRKTEQGHLKLIEGCLARNQRSWLLPLWRLAGFLTGAIPALFSPNAVFATVAAVETFVDSHYAQQIERLRAAGVESEIAALLERCRQDELHHRDEALAMQSSKHSLWLRVWCQLVGSGSGVAVAFARWI